MTPRSTFPGSKPVKKLSDPDAAMRRTFHTAMRDCGRIPQSVCPAMADLSPEAYASLTDADTHLVNVASGIRTAYEYINMHLLPLADSPEARRLLEAEADRAWRTAERICFDRHH